MNTKLKPVLLSLLVGVLSFGLTYTNAFYQFDKFIADPIFQKASNPNPNIKIIAIDERTLAKYGNVTDWSRQIPADLVHKLNEDEATRPAVIGFDVLYIADKQDAGDEAFANACKQYGNVISSVNCIYRADLSVKDNQTLEVDENYVEAIEYPYLALRQGSTYGFVNTTQDIDGYIRYAKLSVRYLDETIYSLPAQMYIQYMANQGLDVTLPATFSNDLFTFKYTGKGGSTYEHLSLCDVLDDKIPLSVFKDAIVFVGAYAPGMMDSYNVANDRGNQMYGVEIHANIMQAMMDGHTGVSGNGLMLSCIVALVSMAFYLITASLKIVPATIVLAVTILADLLTGNYLYQQGLVINIIEIPLFALFIYGYNLVIGYVKETLAKRKVVSAFKKYVAPQVVDEISKKGEFEIKLGGEKRDIAVLFVDIRGFTPMSEGLEPEQVVEILNEYLSLTTNSIFKNNGTLDKFVGDATMAVFNAPFDLDDYVYRAVCTARDIAAGSEALEAKLMERFGKSVSFGIGVNCGPAVVGNIGCEFRMDYTAIGDTVNTAARLESNAKRGQILISDNVYERLKDRVKVTNIGAIPLKGKSNEVIVYQLDEVL